jgi:hypothetical protein
LVAVRIWKLFGTSLEPAVGFEKRQRRRVVDGGLHAMGIQVRRQSIAAWMLDRIQMINVGAVRSNRGHHDILDLIEIGIVNLRRLLARLGPRRQMRQFGRQDWQLPVRWSTELKSAGENSERKGL